MPPHRAPKNLEEIPAHLAHDRNLRVEHPEAPTAVAQEALVAQPVPEIRALLQAFQGFLQM